MFQSQLEKVSQGQYEGNTRGERGKRTEATTHNRKMVARENNIVKGRREEGDQNLTTNKQELGEWPTA